MRLVLACALAALPVLAAAWPARMATIGPVQRSPRPNELFPTPARGLTVRGEDDPKPTTKRELFDAFARAAGIVLQVQPEAALRLGSDGELGFHRSFEVPADQVWSFVEGVAVSLDLAFELEHRGTPRVLRVASRFGLEGRELVDHAFVVDERDLAEWERHPAWLLTLPMRLEHARAVDVEMDLRMLWSGLEPQRLEDVGEDRMLLMAYGDVLPRLARLVRICDVPRADEKR